jgi:pyruvate/2-oxoglutarate dehydrogenase complex dihydrolipoamide acyltransferase (E2) component
MDERPGHSIEDWRLPERRRPPLLGELVERIDEALATARASEAAVMTVGAAALDAAEQAKRAAELAERASKAMGSDLPRSVAQGSGGATHITRQPDIEDFEARADRIAARLRKLQRLPLDPSSREQGDYREVRAVP